jgi:UMF1 family MFS transporter
MPRSTPEQRGWYLYDWANSAFSVTVVTLFLGPYLTSIAKSAAGVDGRVHVLGLPIDPRSYWSYLVGLSVGAQIVFLPVIGAIVDFGRRKKQALAATAYFGAAATASMFFVADGKYLLGGVLFLIANVTFGASEAIYNSFLPEIAPAQDRDAVSSKGFAIGYLGGGVLLALNLVLFMRASQFGISEAMAIRISLSSAGIWWAGFSIPTLLALRNRGAAKVPPPGQSAVAAAASQLRHTFANMRRYPQTLTFLIAFLLYNDAIQTVLAVAAQFGNDELKIPVSQLTLAILMAQFVGFFGAMVFQRLAAAISAKRAVILSLIVWTLVLTYIYKFVYDVVQFFIVTAVVALVMGGSQALSRSLFSQLVPQGREAEYFSVYEISDKGTSWISPILFGLALQFTGSYRVAILSLVVFFVAGLLVLLRVDVVQGQRDVAAPEHAA